MPHTGTSREGHKEALRPSLLLPVKVMFGERPKGLETRDRNFLAGAQVSPRTLLCMDLRTEQADKSSEDCRTLNPLCETPWKRAQG